MQLLFKPGFLAFNNVVYGVLEEECLVVWYNSYSWRLFFAVRKDKKG